MNVKRLALFTAAALACLHTQAQPAHERNWRDNFTPFADPLNAQPRQLQQPLQLRIPAELMTPSPAARPAVPASSPADSASQQTATENTTNAQAPNAAPAHAGNSDEVATAPAATTVLASLSCATAEQAANLSSPQQALALLQNNQPASATGAAEQETHSADEPLLLTLTCSPRIVRN